MINAQRVGVAMSCDVNTDETLRLLSRNAQCAFLHFLSELSGGGTFASVKRISLVQILARRIGRSHASVDAALQELADKGLILLRDGGLAASRFANRQRSPALGVAARWLGAAAPAAAPQAPAADTASPTEGAAPGARVSSRGQQGSGRMPVRPESELSPEEIRRQWERVRKAEWRDARRGVAPHSGAGPTSRSRSAGRNPATDAGTRTGHARDTGAGHAGHGRDMSGTPLGHVPPRAVEVSSSGSSVNHRETNNNQGSVVVGSLEHTGHVRDTDPGHVRDMSGTPTWDTSGTCPGVNEELRPSAEADVETVTVANCPSPAPVAGAGPDYAVVNPHHDAPSRRTDGCTAAWLSRHTSSRTPPQNAR